MPMRQLSSTTFDPSHCYERNSLSENELKQ